MLLRKINSFGDPRLYAVNEVADRLAHSQQPLVPQRLFINGASGDDRTRRPRGLLGTLLSLLVAEKSGFQSPERTEPEALQSLVDQMSGQAVDNMRHALTNGTAKPKV